MTRLYIHKAVNVPNSGTETRNEKYSTREYKESYAKQPVGVTGDHAAPDDPEVGGKWRSTDSTVEDELEGERKEQRDKDKQNGVIKGTDMLKSLTADLESFIRSQKPSDTEVLFMKEVLGYSDTDIKKGYAIISGHDRHRFNEWLCSRLSKSLNDLVRRS